MKLEQVRTLPGRLLVEPLREKEKTEGGIYIPQNLKPKKQSGKVVYVAEDTPDLKTDIKVDDYILYPPNMYVSIENTVEGYDELRLLNKKDVIFIWNE